jgi:hypothetical protein
MNDARKPHTGVPLFEFREAVVRQTKYLEYTDETSMFDTSPEELFAVTRSAIDYLANREDAT